MPCLSPAELLNLWERAYGLSPARRAIDIVRAGYPHYSWTDVASWPIGFRDRHIARLRATHFGLTVPSVTTCPGCQAPVEFEVSLEQCFQLHATGFDTPQLPALPESVLSVRPLTTADVLEHLESARDDAGLVRRCLTMPDGTTLPYDDLHSLAGRLEALDPEARIEFALQCPACGREWSSLFDIVSVFWIELNTWARRMMQEIHQLATRYGWSEEDILRLSPWRRAIYLSLTGAR